MNWIKKIHKSVSLFSKNKKKQKEFLWLVAGIILIIFGYKWYNASINYTMLIIAAVLFVISFTFPKIIQPILYLWMYFGRILSEITSFIILALIFIFGIIPMGIFYRLSRNKTGWVNVKDSTNFDEQF